jgi:hypothetical protein
MEQYATPVMDIISTVTELPVKMGNFVMTDNGFKLHSEEREDEDAEWYRKAGW